MTSLTENPLVGDCRKPGAADLSTVKECRSLDSIEPPSVSQSHYCARSGNFAYGVGSADHQEVILSRQIGHFVHLSGAILFDGVDHLCIVA